MARLTGIQTGADPAAEVGLMLRGGLTASSAHAFVSYSPASGGTVTFLRRLTDGGTLTATTVVNVNGGARPAPQWLKLIRAGNVVSAYVSADGTAWQGVGQETVALPDPAYVGLAVCSHKTGTLCQTSFDQVGLSAAPVADNAAPGVPSVPTLTGTSDSGISLRWNPVTDDVGISGYNVLRNGAVVGTVAGTDTFFVDSGLPAATTYGYSVQALDAVGHISTASGTLSATTDAVTLPATWNHADVGAVSVGGTAAASGTVFNVKGAGADLAGVTDAFQFAHRTLDGDGELVAKVTALQNTDPGARAGLMIRGSLVTDAPYVLAAVAANGAVSYQSRILPGGGTAVVSGGTGAKLPYWLKVKRIGSALHGYRSADGVTWTQLSADTVPLGSGTYVGLVVNSHKPTTLCAASFDAVALQTSPPAVADAQAPAIPGALSAPTASDVSVKLSLAGVADNTGVVGYKVFRDGTLVGRTPGPGYVDSGLTAATTFNYTVTALDAAGNESAASAAVAKTTAAAATLPAGTSHRDLGAVGTPGGVTYSSTTVTVRGSGAGAVGTSDAVHFVYQTLPGDGDAVVRLTGVTSAESLAKAMLMLREGLGADAWAVTLAVTPKWIASLSARAGTAGADTTTAPVALPGVAGQPVWLRLVRAGTTVSAYVSADGNSGDWTPAGSVDLPGLSGSVFVGMAASGTGPASALVSAVFDNVSLAQPTPGAPTGLKASPGDGRATLTWTAVDGAASYVVKRSGVAGGPYATVKSGQTTATFTNTGLTNGTTYFYVVNAVDAAGHVSANSNEASVTPAVAPAVPAGLTATPGDGQVALTWTTAAGVTGGYSVKRGTAGGGPFTAVKTGLGTGAYTDAGLTNGTTYYYVVTAVSAAGQESANSNVVSAKPTAPPAAPTGLTATAGNAQVILQWKAVTGATNYQVKEATVAGGPYAVVQTSVTGTSSTRTGLTNGTAYFYVVTAVNVGGESPASNEASATPTLPAGAPAGLSGTPSDAQATLSWTASATAKTYTVKRSSTAGGPYVAVKTGLTATTFTNTGLTNGTAYFYVVTAVNAGGESPASNEAKVIPIAPAAKPVGLAAVPGDRQVALSWSASTGATTYTVKRATKSGGPYTTVAAGLTTVASTDPGLTNGTTYYYVVSASNAAGQESANSAQVSATPALMPPAPTGVTAVAGNGQVLVSWKAAAGTTAGYTVKRATVRTGPFTVVQGGVTGTSLLCTGLTNGTAYYFVVTASSAGGEGAASAAVTATPLAPPAAPAGVTATPGNARVTLTWTAVAGATGGYNVKRGTVNGGPYTVVQNGLNATAFTDTGLTNGTAYFYVVTALNAGGESNASTTATTAPVAPPAAPGGVAATPRDGRALLAWDPAVGAASYTLKVATTGGGPYTSVQAGVTTNAFTHAGLTNGNTYFYVVSASNAGGESANSVEVRVTPQPPPPAPTGLAAQALNAKVNLIWNASPGATGYVLRRALTSGGPYADVTVPPLAATGYTDTGLTNGTTYFYVVVALNASGPGPVSSQVSAQPSDTRSPGGTAVLAAGHTHSLAVTANGLVWRWGSDNPDPNGNNYWTSWNYPSRT